MTDYIPPGRSVRITVFTDYAATNKSERQLSPAALAHLINRTSAATKAALPWLKCATFGDRRTAAKSLRHNANLVTVSGIEADYDGGKTSFDAARQTLLSAAIWAILYTSPSHTEAAPRWRILCPFSRLYPPAERDRFMARLSGLFGGVFSRESWTWSQSYYFGHIGNSAHRVEVIDGTPIDLADQLDAAALGRPNERNIGQPPQPTAKPEDISEARIRALVQSLLDHIRGAADGDKHHTLRNTCLAIGGHLPLIGWSVDEAAEQAVGALPSADDWDQARKTARWAIEQGLKKPLQLEDRPRLPAPSSANGEDHEPINLWPDEATPTAAGAETEPASAFAATPFDWDAMLAVPPREWVYGHFLIKRFVSILGAPGGTGKTAYAFALALAVVTGSNLLGETVHEPGNVWIYNLEDPRDELLRRMRAAVQHHVIEREQIEGRLFLDSGRERPLCIASASPDGDLIVSPVVADMIAEIKRRQVILLQVDPFIRSHKLEENNNDQIDFALSLWSQVADQAGCAVLLVHHFRKGGVSGEAAAFRGASALIDAVRAALSQAPMSPEEADRLGISEADRRAYIRVDNAKLNLAPPPSAAVWLQLVGVPLGNQTPIRPTDWVQTVQRWNAPTAFTDLPWPTVVRLLEAIDAGPGGGEFYSPAPQAKDRWAGHVLINQASKSADQAKTILKAWLDNGVLIEATYASKKGKEERGCVRLSQTKFSEMRLANNSREMPDDG